MMTKWPALLAVLLALVVASVFASSSSITLQPGDVLTVTCNGSRLRSPERVDNKTYRFNASDCVPGASTPTPVVPTATASPSPTATRTNTPTPTVLPTSTPIATATVNATATPASTNTPAPPTNTPTATVVPTSTATVAPTATPSSPLWLPAPNSTWQWQLTGNIDTSVNAQVFDVDLFDVSSGTVATLHGQGKRVICYISAGSWEDWRPDASQFPASVKGNNNGWPGEKWLDIRALTILGPIMEARLDLCRSKGFDGVEFDNVDGYSNNSGFPLTGAQQITYNRFLAAEAHERGLSAALKNDVEQVGALVGNFDYAINEECDRYDECDALDPFVNAGKAVFHAEYRSCPSPVPTGFSSILKHLDLDAYRVVCADMVYGTLLTDEANASAEFAAGVMVVHQEIGWDQEIGWAGYEPTNGVFSASYRDQEVAKRDALLAAGMQVVLGVGLQYPPDWAYNDYANSRYRNQYGNETALNLTFNQQLRSRAEQYISRVHSDLNLNNYHAVRVGSGSFIEALLPPMNDDNSYWAFDANAGGGANRPLTIPARPFSTWVPGQTSISQAQVRQWYDWYLDAMVDGIEWQINLYRGLGFTGYIHVLIPGLGSRPYEYDGATNAYLNGDSDTNQTMGRAAVWNRVIDRLPNNDPKLVIHISSLADDSGDPVDNATEPGDQSVEYLTHGVVDAWSATRWITFNAIRKQFMRSGENPAYPHGDYGLQMMQDADRQAKAGGFYLLMWAHDFNLYNGQGNVTLSDYASIIAGQN